jgi:release factor glutamine methyltransferase
MATTDIASWLRAATERLSEADVASPRFDAERLAAHALGVTWSDLWTREGELAENDVRELESTLRRRLAGEPLAYIEGSRVFYGLELECGPGVLVPRPETEVLVDVSLEMIDGVERPVVVDIGTGSGAIGLAIASKRPDAEVVATDVSAEALAYARRNAKKHSLDVWFGEGDLFEAVPDTLRGRVDVIVSNPPYVPDGAGVPNDVKSEPAVAVFGGEIGNDVLGRLVDGARTWLRTGGALVLEIGEPYQADVMEGAEIRDDMTGRPRVIWRRF